MIVPAKLYESMERELGARHINRRPIPDAITANLNPRFTLRPYQEKALRYLLNYWDEDFDGKPLSHHQLLFLMATGAGKTLTMAASMLYLHSRGYRNFLFFVNSTNIINKTRENFLNPASPKYLFAPALAVGDTPIRIREVSNFQAGSSHDINILFTTIQGLHTTMQNPREDSLTLDDFQDKRVVLISDEAHHINVDTKRGAAANQEALFESESWESTVMRIFRADPGNVLLEFTATVDLSAPELAEKYRPRLLVDYPLREFRKDGYSKEVKVLQADLDPWERTLQAVILSQYRRKLFERMGRTTLPVLLIKSRTIPASQAFHRLFIENIQRLNGAELARLQSECNAPAIQSAFLYFEQLGITPENLAMELRDDFAADKLLEVNSKDESEAKQILVNTMETNGLRAVFAVDKLNEGWDVLNLYDIVRLYDTRDSKANAIGKTTMSEAQLIGRGARYCPFRVSPEQPIDMRKYDSDLENEYRVLEELYYHCAHNPKYVQELHTALTVLGIRAPNTRSVALKLKQSFKDTPIYESGWIFLNKRVRHSAAAAAGLPKAFLDVVHRVSLRTGTSQTTLAFDTSTSFPGTDLQRKDYTLANFAAAVLRKAVQKIEFYSFSNLRRYLPELRSVNEFITAPQYLASVRVEVSGPPGMVDKLSPDHQLDIALQLLHELADVLPANLHEFRGSREFRPYPIREVFTDKTLNFSLDGSDDKEFGVSMNNPAEASAYHLNLGAADWYAFNDCFGTSEEKLLIRYIGKHIDALRERYSDIWLLRNEKHFKLYSFDEGRAMEPDFVLFLNGKAPHEAHHWQVFVEPKGQHLLRADEWKERFLNTLKDEAKLVRLIKDRHYAIWGLPFYNEQSRIPAFEAGFAELLEQAPAG